MQVNKRVVAVAAAPILRRSPVGLFVSSPFHMYDGGQRLLHQAQGRGKARDDVSGELNRRRASRHQIVGLTHRSCSIESYYNVKR